MSIGGAFSPSGPRCTTESTLKTDDGVVAKLTIAVIVDLGYRTNPIM
jgi:hypothetical protein